MKGRAHISTPCPPRVTYTTSASLSPDEARRRVRTAYRLLLDIDNWPTPTDRRAQQ